MVEHVIMRDYFKQSIDYNMYKLYKHMNISNILLQICAKCICLLIEISIHSSC